MHKPQGSIFRDHHFHKHPAQSTEFNIQASSFSNTLCTKHRVRYSGIIILQHTLNKAQGSIFRHHHSPILSAQSTGFDIQASSFSYTSCTNHKVQYSSIIILVHTHPAQSTGFNFQGSSVSHTSCTKHRVQYSGIIILTHILHKAQGSIFRDHHSPSHPERSTGFNIQASSFSHTLCTKHRVQYSGVIILTHTLHKAQGTLFRHHHSPTHLHKAQGSIFRHHHSHTHPA